MERWKPNVTVAAIIERNNRFLLVEEHTPDGLRLNNPAGHLDPGESPLEGCERETLEETAYVFHPQFLVGVYLSRSTVSETMPADVTYMRLAFCGALGEFVSNRTLDKGITRTLWLTHEEIQMHAHHMRSPLVVRCINDYLKGQRYPMELIYTDSSVYATKAESSGV